MRDGLQWVFKFSADQPRVPAGQSGGGQWTSGGSSRSPFVTTPQRRTFSTGNYDEQAEFDVVMEARGQQSVTREGITRAQVVRFHARRNAAQAAAGTRYRNSKQTVAQAVDEAIASGHTKYSASNRWTTLTRPSDGSAFRYSGKVERDYINVALNRGGMKRNY